LLKPVLTLYPYNQLYPPFTADKIRLVKFLGRTLTFNQVGLAKRLAALVIILWIIYGVATGKLSAKTFKKFRNNMKMMY
jgi:hypothetical protein